MLALAEIFGELLMLKIVYQGVAGAYSHIAAQNIYPGQDYLPCETFEQYSREAQPRRVLLL